MNTNEPRGLPGLRGMLTSRKWSQARLAGELGTSQVIVSGWCCGRHDPGANVVRRIAALLGCAADELLTSSDVVRTIELASNVEEKSDAKIISDAVRFITNLPKIRAHNGRLWRSDPGGCARVIALILTARDPRRVAKTVAKRTGCRQQTLTCLLDGRSTSGGAWPAFKNELDRLREKVTMNPVASQTIASIEIHELPVENLYELDSMTGDIYMITKRRIKYGTPEHQACFVQLQAPNLRKKS